MTPSLRTIVLGGFALFASVAGASYHTFKIDEIFSNGDGTVQYVVLHESMGLDGQNELIGQSLTNTGAAGTNTFVFTKNLPGGVCDYYGCMASPTANRRVLIASQGFNALGFIKPDYVVQNGFLPTGGGTLNYAGVDFWTYGPLPLDGVNALFRSGSVTKNLATNFAGESVSMSLAAPTLNVQGLWWNAPANSESGWGVNLAHQADTIFLTWFTYDGNGRGWWLVMTAQKTGPGTYSGALLETRGPPFNAVPFDPNAATSNPVGTGTLTFTDADHGKFNYVIGTLDQTKTIVRQVFGPLPTCTWGALNDLTLARNYQDLWWAKPAASESGWGINLNHQGDTIFATWFTYDLTGLPMWLVVTAQKIGPQVFQGDLLRTTGPPFSGPFDPNNVHADTVGTAKLAFFDGNNGTFVYSVKLPGMTTPADQTKSIVRQVFAAPGTTCQ